MHWNMVHWGWLIPLRQTQIHSKLRNINLLNVTPSLIFQSFREWMFSIWISLLIVMFPSHISYILTLKWTTKQLIPHACTHHIVVIIINIVMLLLCCFIMSHVTLILLYHAFVLTSQNFLISRAPCWFPQTWYYKRVYSVSLISLGPELMTSVQIAEIVSY